MRQLLASDTPVHIEAGIIALLRGLPPARKLELARDTNRMADRLALAGMRRRRAAAAAHELGYALALQRIPPEQRARAAVLLKGQPLMPDPVDPLALALGLGAMLDAQGIPYVIVGSVAAIVHGEYRTTRDLDVVLNLHPDAISALVQGLREGYIFAADDIIDALLHLPEARADWRQRASFCAYEKTTGFQIDIYLSSGRPFEVMQFQRAQVIDIPGPTGGMLRVASAEDTVLAKLEWYRLAPSDRQWRDVQAILRVQDAALDLAYLRHWAAELDLTGLLDRALEGQRPPEQGVTTG